LGWKLGERRLLDIRGKAPYSSTGKTLDKLFISKGKRRSSVKI